MLYRYDENISLPLKRRLWAT